MAGRHGCASPVAVTVMAEAAGAAGFLGLIQSPGRSSGGAARAAIATVFDARPTPC